ncbi:hypothetical protein Bca4012_038909 [Brassica carinata]
MSAQKIQLASLILAFFLLISQSTAKCHYRFPPSGPCKRSDDCKNVCTMREEDPTFLLCFVNAPMFGKSVLENSAVHLTLSINNAASSVLGESAVFTTPERNLLMMEQLSQNGKTLAADSLTHHSDEAVESHGIVFTTPEQVLLMGDYGREDVEKQVDCDNITGANIIAKSHDMSDVLAASKSPFLMENFEPVTAKKQEREDSGVQGRVCLIH